MQNVLAMPTSQALIVREELPWPERATALKIVDAYTLQLAADERNGCKDLIKQAHSEDDPICDSAYKHWQLTLADRKKKIDPLEEAVRIYDRGIIAFDRAEKERAREEQRRIEREAYQKQLEEREAQVEHLEVTGGTANEVQSVIERAIPLPVAPTAVMATPAAPAKAIGLSKVQENWNAEITDMWAFCEFAVKSGRRELIALLAPDKVACRRLASSTKGAMEVPGLRFWDEGKVASAPKKAGN